MYIHSSIKFEVSPKQYQLANAETFGLICMGLVSQNTLWELYIDILLLCMLKTLLKISQPA